MRWVKGPGRHPVSSNPSRAAQSSSDSPSSSPTARDLPPPRVGDEPVAPQQQHAPRRVEDDGAGRRERHAHDVVVEPFTAGHLDIDESQVDPVALVDRAFPVHRPFHGASLPVDRSLDAGRSAPGRIACPCTDRQPRQRGERQPRARPPGGDEPPGTRAGDVRRAQLRVVGAVGRPTGEADVGDQRVVERQVLAGRAVRRDHGDAALAEGGDAHPALAVDGQRVEQVALGSIEQQAGPVALAVAGSRATRRAVHRPLPHPTVVGLGHVEAIAGRRQPDAVGALDVAGHRGDRRTVGLRRTAAPALGWRSAVTPWSVNQNPPWASNTRSLGADQGRRRTSRRASRPRRSRSTRWMEPPVWLGGRRRRGWSARRRRSTRRSRRCCRRRSRRPGRRPRRSVRRRTRPPLRWCRRGAPG